MGVFLGDRSPSLFSWRSASACRRDLQIAFGSRTLGFSERSGGARAKLDACDMKARSHHGRDAFQKPETARTAIPLAPRDHRALGEDACEGYCIVAAAGWRPPDKHVHLVYGLYLSRIGPSGDNPIMLTGPFPRRNVPIVPRPVAGNELPWKPLINSGS